MSGPVKTSSSSVAKRMLLGRAFTSANLEHTLLPKILALPVFASDALSSVAYATGEILIALTLATTNPTQYVMPIAVAIAALMAIVVGSYRQTVRAYPGGGGAYIVTKENLGVLPGLVAAAALLFDYMMTVVVSIVAGVFAIGSAFPWANEHKVLLSLVFVVLITLANLRGTKESGTVFAIPTYGFVAVDLRAVCWSAFVKCLGGCPTVVPPSEQIARAGRRRRHHDLRHLEGVLAGGDGAHRRRGDLRRRPRLQTPAGQERGRHAGDHGRPSGSRCSSGSPT